MFQLAVIMTFDQEIRQEDLFQILDTYANVGTHLRGKFPQLLAHSVNIPKNDPLALDHVRAWVTTFDGVNEAEVQRGLDLMYLAAQERGDNPPTRAI